MQSKLHIPHRACRTLQYMTEAVFNWRMMKTICAELHVYDEGSNYKAFDSVPGHESPLFTLQRKYLPNTYTAS